MAEESFLYKVEVTFSEAELQDPGAKAKVLFTSIGPKSKEHESEREFHPLHRKLLYALIGAGNDAEAQLRTAYWYVKLGDDYHYFTDVVLCGSGPSFKAVLPAAYLKDRAGEATEPYLEDLGKIDMPHAWAEEAGRILQDLKLGKDNKGNWTLTANASLSRHALGEFAGVLPCPGPWNWTEGAAWHEEKKPLAQRDHRLVVGAWEKMDIRRPSESLFKSLTDLTSMLQSSKSHVTLIMGEPGAGKEVFSDAMHFGSVMGWNKAWAKSAPPPPPPSLPPLPIKVVKGGKEVRSIAGITLEEFNERLFTVVESPPSTTPVRHRRWCHSGCAASGEPQKDLVQKDLVQEAEGGGTIFLDEFDKPAQRREIYSALLRVLEAKEYIRRTVHGDRIVTSPEGYTDVSWVMAGAFFQVDPRESIPRDLWSRMTGMLNLKNPVANDCDYGATLFMYAYLTQVGATLAPKSKAEEGITKLLEAVSSKTIAFRESVALRILGIDPKNIDINTAAVAKGFHPQPGLRKLANDFAKHLRYHIKFVGDATDTPRGIMKAAEAAFRVVRDRCIVKPDLFLSTRADGRQVAEFAREAAHDALVLSRGPS